MSIHVFDTTADKPWALSRETINGNDAGYESILSISTSGSGVTQCSASFPLLNADNHLDRYPNLNLYNIYPSLNQLAAMSYQYCADGTTVQVGSQFFRYSASSTGTPDGTVIIIPFDDHNGSTLLPGRWILVTDTYSLDQYGALGPGARFINLPYTRMDEGVDFGFDLDSINSNFQDDSITNMAPQSYRQAPVFYFQGLLDTENAATSSQYGQYSLWTWYRVKSTYTIDPNNQSQVVSSVGDDTTPTPISFWQGLGSFEITLLSDQSNDSVEMDSVDLDLSGPVFYPQFQANPLVARTAAEIVAFSNYYGFSPTHWAYPFAASYDFVMDPVLDSQLQTPRKIGFANLLTSTTLASLELTNPSLNAAIIYETPTILDFPDTGPDSQNFPTDIVWNPLDMDSDPTGGISATVDGSPTWGKTSLTMDQTDPLPIVIRCYFSAVSQYTLDSFDLVQIAPVNLSYADPGVCILGASFLEYPVITGIVDNYTVSGLPNGLSIDPLTGIISGSYTLIGAFDATITATNNGGSCTTSVTFNVTLPIPSSLSYATPSLAAVGSSFSGVPTVVGTYLTFTATNLPPGLTIDSSTGIISGVYSAADVSNATVTATNSSGSISTQIPFDVISTASVSISPNAPFSLMSGAIQSVTGTVTGTGNTAIIWTVDGITGGNSTVGTITGTGSIVVYTAPVVTILETHTISATSVVDSSKSASVVVTINP